jgi:hypothetical protein
MDGADRRQESEWLRAALSHVRDTLDELIGHLEHDVLPPRMVATSARHVLTTAVTELDLRWKGHAENVK